MQHEALALSRTDWGSAIGLMGTTLPDRSQGLLRRALGRFEEVETRVDTIFKRARRVCGAF
jgi:hypothetical protein